MANRDQKHTGENDFFQRMKIGLGKRLEKWMPDRKLIVIIYLLVVISAAGICFAILGKICLPKTNNGQLQIAD